MHHSFFLGDLNYRLDSSLSVDQTLEAVAAAGRNWPSEKMAWAALTVPTALTPSSGLAWTGYAY